MKFFRYALALIFYCSRVIVGHDVAIVSDVSLSSYDSFLIVFDRDVGALTEHQEKILLSALNQSELKKFLLMTQLRKLKSGEYFFPGEKTHVISWITLEYDRAKAADRLDVVRSSVGKKIQKILKNHDSIAVLFPESFFVGFENNQSLLLQELGVLTQLALYQNVPSSKKLPQKMVTVHFVLPVGLQNEAALQAGGVIGRYTNLARSWGEEPAAALTPDHWAEQLAEQAGVVGCSCKILNNQVLQSLGMGGILAVNAGSSCGAKLLILEHNPLNPIATIALAGKGVLFDSGGLQIKPSSGMLHMKYDKCGGAAVLAATLALASLRVPIHVIAAVPVVYNKTGAGAYHPRDVLQMMNGLTVEVNNTDAEGRLILADALHYLEKFYRSDVVIDVATLTGACFAALGSSYAGIMSRHERLKQDLAAAGKTVGEFVWELPLEKSYEQAIETPMADLANCGKPSYGAGAIMGGLFLERFVKNPCWAHLDIAGPAAQSPTNWYDQQGATGFGVRLLVEYVSNYRLNRELDA